ncbi:MAG: glycosyltransferase [Verrucomicrobiota bacterium]
MKHIVFYDDNPDFGGHQFMAIRGIAAANRSDQFRSTFVLNPRNERLVAQTDLIKKQGGNLEVVYAPAVTKKFQALRNHVSGRAYHELTNLFTGLAPDLVVCLQGEIEDSSLAMLAAKKAECRLMSYIPVAHTMAQMGAKLGALRDHTTGYLFRVPDAWMTISQCISDMLRQRGANAPIHIVENGIDTGRFLQGNTDEFRKQQGLPDGLLLGLFGRVEYNQKQQDFLLRAMSRWTGELGEAKLLLVGDGPDHSRMTQLIGELNMGDRVVLRQWEKHPERLYPALDCLLIPSRFEGVPLVMLEAAACGVPIVGSDNDGMHDFLPEAWRYPHGDESKLIEALKMAIKKPGALVEEQRRRVLENHTLQQFEDRFVETLIRELP